MRLDPLTGLANRADITDEIPRARLQAATVSTHVGLVHIDLDRFADIDEAIGRQAGDRVLVEIARRLRSTSRSTDVVARLGADEFAVLCHDLDADEAAAWSRLRAAATRIHELLEQPVVIDASKVMVSASIGINVITAEDGDALQLLAQANTAMCEAKALGRSEAAPGEQIARRHSAERLRMASELAGALERDELRVSYQPIIDMATGAMCGSESVLRWQHPEFGEVPRRQFIEIAQDSELIVSLGEFAIEHACSFLTRRHRDSQTPVSVNVSIEHLNRSDVAETVRSALRRFRLRADRLWLELPETALADADASSIRQLESLRKLGVGIGLDDFGSGDASLTTLRDLPISFVKTAPRFTWGLGIDPDDHTFCDAAIALGRALGLEVIADGVQTREQANVLGQLGCRFAQGELFGGPESAARSWGPGTTERAPRSSST